MRRIAVIWLASGFLLLGGNGEARANAITIETELLGLSLRGDFMGVEVSVIESATQKSTGLVEITHLSDTLHHVDSFFDVVFQIQLGSDILDGTGRIELSCDDTTDRTGQPDFVLFLELDAIIRGCVTAGNDYVGHALIALPDLDGDGNGETLTAFSHRPLSFTVVPDPGEPLHATHLLDDSTAELVVAFSLLGEHVIPLRGTGTIDVRAVPEPSTALLLGIAALCTAARRRGFARRACTNGSRAVRA
jgi:hypothetical protein